MPERPSIYEQEHEDFRATARAFLEKEVKPFHDQWEQDGQVDREVWRKAGEAGLLCFDVDEEYGGAGVKDFRYNVVLTEEITRAGASGARLPGAQRHDRPLHLRARRPTSRSSAGCPAWSPASSSPRSR